MWVDGVVRVVCGLTLDTSCQDVVIALAQAIGQTGRYILILKLRGGERQLVADDCPLQRLAQLGQLATEVQFILRRTGPSLSDASDTPTTERPEAEPLKRKESHKTVTFSQRSSKHSKRTKPNRTSSPRASPEPQASPVSFLDPVNPVNAIPSKEEVFRQILQQQMRLEDLEIQLQALERETGLWEQESSSAIVPVLWSLQGELEELEQQQRQNEAELMQQERWEEELQAEVDREQDLHRRLNQIHSSMDDHSYQMKELQAYSAHLEEDLQLRAHRQSSRQPEEPLKQELHHCLQQAEELDATLLETQRKLQAAEESLQDRWEMTEELKKELRQCNLQQFIQQTSSPHADQTNVLPVTDAYLSSAGIME